MKMNIDEKLKSDILFVINKINKQVLLSGDSGDVIYNLPVYPHSIGRPNTVDEQMIIRLLESEKAISKISGDDEYTVESNSKVRGVGLTIHLSVSKKKLIDYQNKLLDNGVPVPKNKLTISSSGSVSFVSPDNKKYHCKLGTKTNAYLVLRKLATDPTKIFSFDDLAEVLNHTKGKSSSEPTEERRVRDAIGTLRDKLGYRGKDLFKVDYGFGLKCAVEIVQ